MALDHGALLAATVPDAITFMLAALICVVGAGGVVLLRNPVHAALSLVATLFGIAVLFVEEDAQFLAAVQVIVYAGAIVVLFLFVIMLLGVDRRESVFADQLKGQRVIGIGLGVLVLVEVLLFGRTHWSTGAHSVSGKLSGGSGNVAALGQSVFTTYLLAFEITSALLVIAIVGAVVLSRRPTREQPADVDRPETTPVLPAAPETGGASEADSGAAAAPIDERPDTPADAPAEAPVGGNQ